MISFVQLSLPMSFPHYYQQDSRDCGPSCLRMIARFYGKDYSAEEMKRRCFSSREGVSLLDISEAAESIGFRTIGVKITWEQFRNQLPFPAIVHWNHNHFVVVYDSIKRRHRIWIRVADEAPVPIRLEGEGLHYQVGVSLLDGLNHYDGYSSAMLPEMDGTAEITTGEARLIRYLINPANSLVKRR